MMARNVSGGLEGLELTNDELGKLKKAFADPEFRRLFKEYAEEITDPENRKRLEGTQRKSYADSFRRNEAFMC